MRDGKHLLCVSEQKNVATRQEPLSTHLLQRHQVSSATRQGRWPGGAFYKISQGLHRQSFNWYTFSFWSMTGNNCRKCTGRMLGKKVTPGSQAQNENADLTSPSFFVKTKYFLEKVDFWTWPLFKYKDLAELNCKKNMAMHRNTLWT